MKKTFFTIFRILLGIVLLGKITNWFLNYSDETNQILNTAIFTLIGIAYTIAGFISDKNLTKIIFIVCGLYLIIMNLINKNTILTIIGIICILTPLLISRFSLEKTDEKELTES